MLYSYQVAPHDGHLQQRLHIFASIKKNPKPTFYFNPNLAIIDPTSFTGSKPKEFRDKYICTSFDRSSHAADKKMRRSHTIYITFVNCSPIIWYSKQQATVGSSTFSSEFIALNTCVEHIIGLRFKLRMFEIPIYGEAIVLNENKSVVDFISKLESTLNKKHISITYQRVIWNVASSVVRIGCIEGISRYVDSL